MSTLKSGMWPRKKRSEALGCGTRRYTCCASERRRITGVERRVRRPDKEQRVLFTLQCKFNSVRLREFRLEVPRNLKERNTAVW